MEAVNDALFPVWPIAVIRTKPIHHGLPYDEIPTRPHTRVFIQLSNPDIQSDFEGSSPVSSLNMAAQGKIKQKTDDSQQAFDRQLSN